MHIKSIVAGAAIALAATVGSASAADQFATLGGVTVQPMNAGEMAAVVGAHIIITITPPAGGDTIVELDTHAPLKAAGGGQGIRSFGTPCPPECGGGTGA